MFAFLVLSGLILFSCRTPRTLEQTRSKIEKDIRRQPGTIAVAFKDMNTGSTLLINEEESFHAASTMKTPIMIELFKQVKAGKFSLRDSVEVVNEFRSIIDGSKFHLQATGDSERRLYQRIGRKQTLDTLITKMITVSSNLATNILISMVSPDSITRSMRNLGAPFIQVKRGVEDSIAFALGINNTTTALDQLRIYEKLAKGEVVDQFSSESMIHILRQQRFNEVIPKSLPANVKVAHKTGSIQGVRHDAGVVELPDGRRYVLVLLSKGLTREPKAIRSMIRISKRLYRWVLLAQK